MKKLFRNEKQKVEKMVMCKNCNESYNIYSNKKCPNCGIAEDDVSVKTLNDDLKIVDVYKYQSRMLRICDLSKSLSLYFNESTKTVYMGQKFTQCCNTFTEQSYCPFYSENGKLMKYDAENECLIEIN